MAIEQSRREWESNAERLIKAEEMAEKKKEQELRMLDQVIEETQRGRQQQSKLKDSRKKRLDTRLQKIKEQALGEDNTPSRHDDLTGGNPLLLKIRQKQEEEAKAAKRRNRSHDTQPPPPTKVPAEPVISLSPTTPVTDSHQPSSQEPESSFQSVLPHFPPSQPTSQSTPIQPTMPWPQTAWSYTTSQWGEWYQYQWGPWPAYWGQTAPFPASSSTTANDASPPTNSTAPVDSATIDYSAFWASLPPPPPPYGHEDQTPQQVHTAN
jgi:hypothetical protein